MAGIEKMQVTRHHLFSDIHNLVARIFKDVMDSTQLSIAYFAPRYTLRNVRGFSEKEKSRREKKKETNIIEAETRD